MGVFRDRMDQDMQIRGLSARTREEYLACAKNFVKYYRTPPDQLGLEEFRLYQLHLINDRKISFSYFNQIVCALRFLFNVTLQRGWDLDRLPYQKREQRLPPILSEAEVAAIIESAACLRDRSILMILYGCGLRVAELQHLGVADIDSGRMMLRVQLGKGAKDRDVPLPERLLPVLRQYWTTCRPRGYLFLGGRPGQPLSAHVIQTMVKSTAQRAGVAKHVTPHVLRHAFATHHLEHGANIRQVQLLLGHRSLRSTMRYLHVSGNSLRQTASPLDRLPERITMAPSW